MQRIRIVDGRLGVRHHDNGGITALCRRPGTGFDIFLIGEAGIPEMRMHINQSRQNRFPGSVNHRNLRLPAFAYPGPETLRKMLSNASDPPFIQKNIRHILLFCLGIDNQSVLNQNHSVNPFSSVSLPGIAGQTKPVISHTTYSNTTLLSRYSSLMHTYG